MRKSRLTGKGAVPAAVGIGLTILALVSGMDLVRTAFSGQENALQPSAPPTGPCASDEPSSEEQAVKGKFLVAKRSLTDPNFSKTVVLLIEHGRLGVMGLVINRPTAVKLSEAFPDIEGLEERGDTLYIGGPVAPSRLVLLMQTGRPPEESHHVFEDIYVSSSRAVLERLIHDADPNERFRVYAGHSGWGPGQLDFEISIGSWLVLKADAKYIFQKDPADVWLDLIDWGTPEWVRSAGPQGDASSSGRNA